MARPLELAFLLANLRAIGLMRDSDFQRFNSAIIQVVKKSIYRDLEKDPYEDLDGERVVEPPPDYTEWSTKNADADLWKYVISIFNALQRNVREHDFSCDDSDWHEGGYIFNNELESIFTGSDLPDLAQFGYGALGMFDTLEGRSAAYVAVSHKDIADLHMKVSALEHEIADLRQRATRSASRDGNAATPTHSRNAEDERAKKSKIAELQDDLNRELRSAAFYDRDGDAFNAGSAKARAARIESKLRALGA